MKMKMPEIKIDNNSKFAAVAMVVDHPQVELFVRSCRKKLYSLHKEIHFPYSYDTEYTIGRDIFYKLSIDAEIYYQKIKDSLELMDNRKNDRFYAYEEKKREEIEVKLKSVSTDQLRFDKDIDNFLEYHRVPDEYKQVLQRLILNDEIREVDYKGKPLGRWENVKTQRHWYWQNRRAVDPFRLGYKRLGKREGRVQKTIESGIRNYKSHLDTTHKGLVLDQEIFKFFRW